MWSIPIKEEIPEESPFIEHMEMIKQESELKFVPENIFKFEEILIDEPKLSPPNSPQQPNISKRLECSYCQKQFQSFYLLKTHIRRSHNRYHEQIKKLKCPHCFFKAHNLKILKSHLACNHDQSTKISHNSNNFVWFNCKYCVFKSKSKRSLEKHSETCCGVKIKKWFECPLCPHHFEVGKPLIKHPLQHPESNENSERLECTLCNYKTTVRNNLAKHLLNKHSPDTKINWLYCGSCCFRKNRCKLRQLNTKKGECGQCGFRGSNNSVVFTTIGAKTKSNKVKSKEFEIFKCGDCPKQFKSMASLLVHHDLENHSGRDISEINWSCCTESMTLIVDKKVNEIEWFNCEFCEFKTRTRFEFDKHIQTKHADEKNQFKEFEVFKCGDCTKQYRTMASLIVHFGLENHSQSTTGINSFCCNQCKYKSSNEASLRVHIQTTHVAKQISLESSNKIVTSKQNLKHLSSQHPFLNKNDVAKKLGIKKKKSKEIGSGVWCVQCSLELPSQEALDKHVKKVHVIGAATKSYECASCGWEGTKSEVVQHSKIQHDIRCIVEWFECSYCKHKTTSKSDFIEHVFCQHPESLCEEIDSK